MYIYLFCSKKKHMLTKMCDTWNIYRVNKMT